MLGSYREGVAVRSSDLDCTVVHEARVAGCGMQGAREALGGENGAIWLEGDGEGRAADGGIGAAEEFCPCGVLWEADCKP